MGRSQRYISDELTHFLGTNLKKDEDRYKLLLKIIEEGRLTSNPVNPDSYSLSTDFGSPRMSHNEVFNPNKVCFCDIPVEDLDIHMGKYSYFGLSFSKKYLVEKGANPVFYIANNSKTMNKEPRGQYFDEAIEMCGALYDLMEKHIEKDGDKSPQMLELWNSITFFLGFYVFSFIKCFDDGRQEGDPDNFYMEREWRLLGSLKFRVADIYRIIMPQQYSERFRKDIPGYFGQITFSHP